jgi:hypothetical protein
MFILDRWSGPHIWIFSFPNIGVKKAPDPGSQSATLQHKIYNLLSSDDQIPEVRNPPFVQKKTLSVFGNFHTCSATNPFWDGWWAVFRIRTGFNPNTNPDPASLSMLVLDPRSQINSDPNILERWHHTEIQFYILIFLHNKVPKLAQIQIAFEVKKKEGLRLRFYPWKKAQKFSRKWLTSHSPNSLDYKVPHVLPVQKVASSTPWIKDINFSKTKFHKAKSHLRT